MTKVVHCTQLKTGWWLVELEEKRWWRRLPTRQQYLVSGTKSYDPVYKFPDLSRSWNEELLKQLVALEMTHPQIMGVLNKYPQETEMERGEKVDSKKGG